ncbi:PREDICTED: F-box/LRR-repeat protein At2g43260-like [Camelina sativa]|uniref:F-box/LRR-repeat protein At2g43260-like n=1 Tax=Camelina sativa TaxID=90675 RepID=A0ABM0W6K3_CAMSA|nr:PREDICTED: F-box/LRR-repeat protein At2g43260-like [Camelina sativa]
MPHCPLLWHYIFPALWAMGFGRDKVSKSFKVVRMFFDPYNYCEVLDVNIGEWRRTLSAPPYLIDPRRKSACVNGSIYWLNCGPLKLLAFDLHTQKFRDVPFLPPSASFADQLVNLDDRLAIATPYGGPWKLEIWTMDLQKEEDGWSMTYSIPLSTSRDLNPSPITVHFRPLTVSKEGNVFFHDNDKRLLVYEPKTNLIRCISKDTWVLLRYPNCLNLCLPYCLPLRFFLK